MGRACSAKAFSFLNRMPGISRAINSINKSKVHLCRNIFICSNEAAAEFRKILIPRKKINMRSFCKEVSQPCVQCSAQMEIAG